MRCLRRVQRLELRQCAPLSDPLRVIRNEAFDRLDYSDRKVISDLAFQYQNGNEVEERPEVQGSLARWGDLSSRRAGQPREASRLLN